MPSKRQDCLEPETLDSQKVVSHAVFWASGKSNTLAFLVFWVLYPEKNVLL